MSERPEEFERLESPLEAAVQRLVNEPVPDEAVARVKARARQLTAAPPRPAPRRRRLVRRPVVVGLAVAATLLAMVLGGWSLLSLSGGQAFAAMLEKVKNVHSVTFKTTTSILRGQEQVDRWFLEGERLRLERFDGKMIEIADLAQRQCLVLSPEQKLAQVMPIDAQVTQGFANPIEQLRRLNSGDAERIGEEPIAGRPTTVYRIRKIDFFAALGRGEMLVWVDRESELPVKITIRSQEPKSPVKFLFDEFAWNQPLDAKLFSLEIPEGYQKGVVVTLPVPQEPAAASAAQANPNYASDGVLSSDRVASRLIWSPDGTTLTAMMQDPESVPPPQSRLKELRQWDVNTGKLRWSTTVGGLNALAATSDGKTLATLYNFEIQLRDAASGKKLRSWDSGERVSPLALSPDGKTLAAGITEWGKHGGRGGKESGGVQFWEVEGGRLLSTIPEEKPTTVLWYSSDGKFVATASGGSVRLWDVATGQLTRVFSGFHAAFSPTGELIACQLATTKDEPNVGRVELSRLQDGSPVKTFVSEPGKAASWLTSLGFSPDGRLLVATDWNGTVTLWDVSTGQRRQTFQEHQAGVLAVAFSPDGTRLATGSEDKTLRVRKLVPGDHAVLPGEDSQN